MNKSSFLPYEPASELELATMRHVSGERVSSQRELAKRLGISVGRMNFVLRALLTKGLLKVENFRRSDRKIGYLYLLTPTGIAEKARLTHEFIAHKEAEHSLLVREIATLKEELLAEPVNAATTSSEVSSTTPHCTYWDGADL